MAIPQFDELFNPTLSALHNFGGIIKIRDLEQEVARILNLSVDEINEIHRGVRTKLSYRLAWSRSYLKSFGLIEKIERGKWGLTEAGRYIKSVNKEDVKRSVRNNESQSINQKEEDENIIESDLDDEIERDIDNPQIEKEDTDSYEIKEPFDPRAIDIKTKQIMLKALFERIRYDEIDLFTEFQREGNIWDITKQSRLIESILIRLPLPAFYFDGSDDNKWLIVDGLQRISTLKNFVLDKEIKGERFALKNLEFLKDFENLTYDDLSREMKRRIDETEITIYIISPGTPIEVKYNLFRRINTGGVNLTPQEIRNALNQGVPANFIKELSSLPEFKLSTSNAIGTNRMLDRDFVTRFVSFYLLGVDQYKPDLDTFLTKGMEKIGECSEEERLQLKSDFIRSMQLSADIFGDYAFRKRFKLNDTKKPINKALFETWSLVFSKVDTSRTPELIDKKNKLIQSFINLMNNDIEFVEAISSSTGSNVKVHKRFYEIENLVKNILT